MATTTEGGTDGAMVTNGGGGGGMVPPVIPATLKIQASDNPGQLFVGELLNDSNYGEWVTDMTEALIAKNKLGIVDGSVVKPEAAGELREAWLQCDALVKGWLKTAMDKEVRSSIRYAKTAREMWVDLEARFGKGSAPRAYELRQLISSLRQEKLSVSTFFTKLRGYWEEMQTIKPIPRCTCGQCTCDVGKQVMENLESDRLFDFLMGLGDAFATVKTQILSMRPTPTLGEAYRLVATEEQHKQISANMRPHVEAAALQTSRGQDAMDAGRGSERGRNADGKSVLRCSHCQKRGHQKESCFELIGYPAGWVERKPRSGDREERQRDSRPNKSRAAQSSSAAGVSIPGLSSDQVQQLLQFLNQSNTSQSQNTESQVHMAGKFSDSSEWVIDSGCNEYITNDEKLLENSGAVQGYLPVSIPNGDKVAVKRVGDVSLSNGMKLSRVLSIPLFKCNLLSVSRLTQDFDVALTFLRDFCVIQDLHSRTTIGTGQLRDGLYYLRLLGGPVSHALTASGDDGTGELWHSRLGHPSPEKASFLFSSIQNKCKVDACDSCIRAKQTRLPFPRSSIRTNRCFELVHVDIWGGFKVPTQNSTRYFLTIVDDFSRATWVYLLSYKSDVEGYLKMFINMAETQFDKKVSRVQADNGLEFQTNSLRSFYEDRGIVLQTTCTDTPQQNGVVERKHRHLLETARALRFRANLPLRFWGECILTAVYLINRLPSKVLQNRTPYEILLGKLPSYKHLRVFGCLAYGKDTHKGVSKFGERGRRSVFMGYPAFQKGYRLYDLNTHTFYTCRDVHFVEWTFPFHEQSTSSPQPATSLPSFPALVEDDDDPVMTTTPPVPDDGDCTLPNDSSASEPLHSGSSPSACAPSTALPPHEKPGEGPRRSLRSRQVPRCFYHFEVELPPSNVPYPMSNFVRYAKFSSGHKSFLAAVSSKTEPTFFKDAVRYREWREAMQREIDALVANGTWSLVELPPGKKVVSSKWVFKIKYKQDGTIERYKARLVAKGFTQTEGIDYHDTFAPVAKLVSVRCLLAVAAIRGWAVHQLDVDNAFLHGDLQEEVYMQIPPGFAAPGDTRVCRLHKSIYGLKQASRNWYAKFTTTLTELGFQRSRADYSMFVRRHRDTYVVALIYVDDVILAGDDMEFIQHVKDALHRQFGIKNLGPLKYFLGIEVARSRAGIALCQRKYTLDLLQDSGLSAGRPSLFPIEQQHQLTRPPDDDSTRVSAEDAAAYRRLIGRLQYLTVTRPDIVYAVNILSRYVHAPTLEHVAAADRVLRYLKSAPGQGILLPSTGDLRLTAYCDADWGGCQSSRHSTSGYFVTLGTAPISWRTKKQSVVARSSAEAEYRSMAGAVSEVIWLGALLRDLGIPSAAPTVLYCDNQAALHIAANPVFHERTKHVEMDCYFVRDHVTSGEILPQKISTHHQLADLFTKGLGGDRFQELLSKLGICNLHASACGGV
ncbi:unnamed protein product [Linum trigynum]|uniref:Integrase catalytic domain-containing protein n=1 Tax=Linum trigynum TaxID=586398 RepID=A0AAV2G5T8_9ROSI